MHIKLLFIVCFSLGFICPALGTPAQKIIGTFGDWSVISSKQNGTTVCMMSSQPIKSQGKYSKRGDVFLTVSRRSDDNWHDAVHFTPGYTYQKGSVPTLKVDKKKSVLMTAFDTGAWLKKDETDTKVILSFKQGGLAVIQGRSARKTLTTDTFSLKGFGKAYQAMTDACH